MYCGGEGVGLGFRSTHSQTKRAKMLLYYGRASPFPLMTVAGLYYKKIIHSLYMIFQDSVKLYVTLRLNSASRRRPPSA